MYDPFFKIICGTITLYCQNYQLELKKYTYLNSILYNFFIFKFEITGSCYKKRLVSRQVLEKMNAVKLEEEIVVCTYKLEIILMTSKCVRCLYYAEQLSHCALLWQPLARGSPCAAVSSHHARNRRCFKNILVGLVSNIKIVPQFFLNQWATDKFRCETLTGLIVAYSATAHQTNSQRKSSWHAQCCRKLQV